MKKILIGLLAIAISTSAIANTSPVRIYEDRGGIVMTKFKEFLGYKARGRDIQILGICDSACTIALFVNDDICVGKNAKFGFHSAFVPNENRVGMTKQEILDAVRETNDWFLDHYPEWVIDIINQHGGLSKKLIVIDYKIAKKYLKTC
jgi:hypothetical protein